MRITIKIKGYYDWVPAPPGTQITEDDIKALRVKQMGDDRWHVRAAMKADVDQNFDMGLHEESIARQLAAHERFGKGMSREDMVVYMVREATRHHLHHTHLVKIIVADDGPVSALYEAALVESGVPVEQHLDLIAAYMDTSTDMSAYLNAVFKTESTRRPK